MSKADLLDAELVLMPYNYLVDRKTAQTISSLDLTGAIVIFDEAHNVESTCDDASSTEISSEILENCLKEVKACQDLLRSGKFMETVDETVLEQCLVILLRIRAEVEGISFDSEGRLLQRGEFMTEFLSRAGITEDGIRPLIQDLEAISGAYLESEFGKRQNALQSSLQILSFSLRTIYKISNADDEKENQQKAIQADQRYFRVFAEEVDVKSGAGNSLVKKTKILNYWCFNPGIALRSLQAKGIYSIILTSGTLSPLSSFASELQISFPFQLENSHVISGDQVFCSVVTNGPNGGALNSSFQQRNSDTYRHELGQSILKVCQVVPDGVLIFFPSYSLMDQCLTAWKADKVFEKIAAVKTPIIEPRNKGDLPKAMDSYYRSISSGKGSIFYAVCRGKVSEGLDFADSKGRAVIITGIPFPPLKDPRVILKRQYLNDAKNEKKTTVPINGDEWYNQQATRAVNQAIGRVIRHRHDFGAILLFDDRFASPRMMGQLSKWLRPHVKVHNSFSGMRILLNGFFDNRRADTQAVETVRTENIIFRGFKDTKETMEVTRSFFDTDKVIKENSLIPKAETVVFEPCYSSTFIKAFAVPEKSKSEKRIQAQAFLDQVKSRLPSDTTRQFNAALKSYRAEQMEIKDLIQQVLSIFKDNKTEDLISGFRLFISSKHLELFDQMATELSNPCRSLGKRSLAAIYPVDKGGTGSTAIDEKMTDPPSLLNLALSAPSLPSLALSAPSLPSLALSAPSLLSLALSAPSLPSMALSAPSLPSLALSAPRPPCPICTKSVTNGYRAKCGHNKVMFWQMMKGWYRVCGERLVLLKGCFRQKYIAPLRVTPVKRSIWNTRQSSLPFAGERLGVGGGLNKFLKERLVGCFQSAVALTTGYISNPPHPKGPVQTIVVSVNPPQLDLDSSKVMKKFVVDNVNWGRKMQALLTGLQDIEARAQFLTPTMLQIKGDGALISTVIQKAGLAGFQARIVEEESAIEDDDKESLGFSSLSLVFPHLHDHELDAFSDISNTFLPL